MYIHIPWCIKKCPYCDFNSHAKNASFDEAGYVDALIMDLEGALPLIWGRRIQSIFIGGGTPSLFSGNAINRLMEAVRARVALSPMAEVTMEANPGTVDTNHFKEYASSGVNRLSLGIQSFNDEHLKVLGRIHDCRAAMAAIEIAQVHFKNINLDIIYGLPNQTIAEASSDVERAISFAPNHISLYNLTLEPNTLFANNPPQNMPDNDLCYAMQDSLIARLKANGYARYEISAYARDGKECYHNLNYWSFGDYLGIGAGAHSKISLQNQVIRQVRQKHPRNYMADVKLAKHIVENNSIVPHDLPFEFMLNSFRLIDGFALKLFNERTSLPLTQTLPQLMLAVERGFLTLTTKDVIPTKMGQDFLNNLLLLFLQDKTS